MSDIIGAAVAAWHGLRARAASPHSRLFIVADRAGWVLDEEARTLRSLARDLGIPAAAVPSVRLVRRQCVHYGAQFALTSDRSFAGGNRVSFDYFHGTSLSSPSLRACAEALVRRNADIHRLRVSHSLMEQFVLSHGIAREKVRRIPIGIDTDRFRPAAAPQRSARRVELSIPQDAVVIGSFQKDGIGWGEGLEPKYIKGPDVFVRVMELLRNNMPNLWVLLSGPSRGYVMRELERVGVPWRHVRADKAGDIARLYSALDAYLVASRDEGGPKGVLESMASGVPLVTTRVGQAADLVRHGSNGFMVESEDADGLAHWTTHALGLDGPARASLLAAARATAEANDYRAQVPLWDDFFTNYVIR